MKRIIAILLFCCVCFSAVAQIGSVIKLDDIEQTGYEMQKALNEDGSGFIERPYKWYSGIGKADDKQIALEIAQREAYSTISRIIGNIVDDNCEKVALTTEGRVKSALRSYWHQVSQNITKGCEPFGKAAVEFDTDSGMYLITAKVAIRGDRFLKMLGEKPILDNMGLSKEEVSECIEINSAIMSAVKGE